MPFLFGKLSTFHFLFKRDHQSLIRILVKNHSEFMNCRLLLSLFIELDWFGFDENDIIIRSITEFRKARLPIESSTYKLQLGKQSDD